MMAQATLSGKAAKPGAHWHGSRGRDHRMIFLDHDDLDQRVDHRKQKLSLLRRHSIAGF